MSSTSSVSVSAGGIDVTSLVSSLMAVERQPLSAMQTRQAAAVSQASAMDGLRADISSLKTQALSLVGTGLVQFDTTVSNPSAASVTVGSGAAPGAVSFTVDRLASANVLRSSVAATSATDVITDQPMIAVSASAAPLGISSISALVGTTSGATSLSVVQSSSAAMRSGGALAAATTIDASNDTFEIEVNGVTHSVSLAHGTHTAAGLAAALQAAMHSVGAKADSRLMLSGGLQLSTIGEGSAASLKIVGGSALPALGLTADTTAAVGTDAIVNANGVTTTISDASAGATVTVGNGSGSFQLGLSGGLRAGTAKVATVATGGGTLRGVADAINVAGAGVSATVVRAQTGSYYLQLVSGTTGQAGQIVTDTGAFRGGMVQTSAAADAQVTVGAGTVGAYSVTASGNTFDSLLNGVAVTVKDVSTTPVSVNLARNDGATADALGKLVDSVNTLVGKVNTLTKFDAVSRKAGPLAGHAAVRSLAARLRSMITDAVDPSTTPVAVGITTQRDGTIALDRTKFLAALQSDPTMLTRMFGRSGTDANGISFVDAVDATMPGTFAVQVTQQATRATSGSIDLSALGVGQRVEIRRGATVTGYPVQPGATTADIASGIQAALTGAGLAVTLGGSGTAATLTADAWGSAGSFQINTDATGAGAWADATGKDVVGVINGSLATGAGQRLTLPTAARNTAKGLAVNVDASVAPGSTIDVTYRPGVTARMSYALGALSDDGGPLTSSTFNDKVSALTKQMSDFESRMAAKETALRSQWSKIQSTLQSLQSQQNWLSSQFSSSTSG